MNKALELVRREVEALMHPEPEMVTGGRRPPTPRTQRVLQLAQDEARRFGHEYLGVEHLLLAICAEGESAAAQALTNLLSRKDTDQ
jgi:ATP-dependent Clp protease ATP-binding subunit ClpC